jgi:hypothetical protein
MMITTSYLAFKVLHYVVGFFDSQLQTVAPSTPKFFKNILA